MITHYKLLDARLHPVHYSLRVKALAVPSWELEEELAERATQFERSQFEPPRPEEVPVLWRWESRDDQGERDATVLPFRPKTLDHDEDPGATRH